MGVLFDKRALFSRLIPRLLDHMIEAGYVPLIGRDGVRHMKNSLHYDGLAMDIDLFKDGKYLTRTEDHQQFGEWWELLHPDCRWGGRFADGNHYAITYQWRQ